MITDYGGFVSDETSPPSVSLSNFVVTVVACNHLVSLSLPEKKRGQKRNGVGNVILVRRKIQPESAEGQNQYRTLFSVRLILTAAKQLLMIIRIRMKNYIDISGEITTA